MLFSLFIATFSLSFNLFYAFLFIVLCKNKVKLMKHKTYFGFRRLQQRQKTNVDINVMSETLDMIRIGKMWSSPLDSIEAFKCIGFDGITLALFVFWGEKTTLFLLDFLTHSQKKNFPIVNIQISRWFYSIKQRGAIHIGTFYRSMISLL
jgi:hypothetical protein